ncbi:MAG: transcription antitermination factor NusB [Clostridiaceae bacterium]|nr:transcription antitermination factor NusB [Clostridiaceae bacterium]
MGRRAAREKAFKLLYQIDIRKGDKDEIVDSFLGENDISPHDKEYVRDVVLGTMSNIEDIDNWIDNNLVGWKRNRISKVNLAILRLAIYEMLKREDIPVSVSINEAIELAKTYDGAEAGAFVNGVLGSISKKLELNRQE